MFPALSLSADKPIDALQLQTKAAESTEGDSERKYIHCSFFLDMMNLLTAF